MRDAERLALNSATHQRGSRETGSVSRRDGRCVAHVVASFVLAAIAFLPLACGRKQAPSYGTGFSHVEALGLQRVEAHSSWASGTLTVNSSADFTVSVDAMYAACRADLQSDQIVNRNERSSGEGDERIEDTNGSGDRVQRACRVRGRRGRNGGRVELMVARVANAPPPSFVGGACGPSRCSSGAYCFHVAGQGAMMAGQPSAGRVDSYECRSLPPQCVSTPTCACLGDRSCRLEDGRPFVEVQPP